MTRLHADPVEVRRRDDLPEQFLWRGRLYLVREVLARWTQTGRCGAGADSEQEWFRVEASCGRTRQSGVYDLAFEWSGGHWSMARVQD